MVAFNSSNNIFIFSFLSYCDNPHYNFRRYFLSNRNICKRKADLYMSLKEFFINIGDIFKKLMADGEEIQRQKEVQIQENIKNAGEKFINGYGEKFHCSNEQYARFQRSLSTASIGKVVSLNKKKINMKICSARDPKNVYCTSFSGCDCEDYKRRNLPCKHIYKFAYELGIIDETWDLSGLSPDLKELLDSLSPTAMRTLIRLMENYHYTYKFEISKRTVSPLVKCGLLIEDNSYSLILDKKYNKDELLAFLASSPSCTVSSKDKKTQIIRYIIDNEPKLLKALCDKFYTVSFSDTVNDNFDYIYRYCENLQ